MSQELPSSFLIIKEPPFPASYDRDRYIARVLGEMSPSYAFTEYRGRVSFQVRRLPGSAAELNRLITADFPNANLDLTLIQSFDDTDGGKGVRVSVFERRGEPTRKERATEPRRQEPATEAEQPTGRRRWWSFWKKSKPADGATTPADGSTTRPEAPRAATGKHVTVLLSALSNRAWEIRAAACQLLGETGDTTIIEPLTEVLKKGGEDSLVKERAADGLRTCGRPEVLELIKKWEWSGRPVFLEGSEGAQAMRAGRARVDKVVELLSSVLHEVPSGELQHVVSTSSVEDLARKVGVSPETVAEQPREAVQRSEEDQMLDLVAEAMLEFGPQEAERLIRTLSAKELKEFLDSRRGR